MPIEPSTNPHVVLVLPDGPAVRSFGLSGIAARLAQGTDPCRVSVFAPSGAMASGTSGVTIQELPDVREGRIQATLRSARAWADRPVPARKPNGRTPRTYAQALLIRAIGTAAAVIPGGRRYLGQVHEATVARSAASKHWTKLLRELEPDLVLCGHQRAGRATAAMVAAKGLGVSTATFVYSWDNVAKGAFAFSADHYLVWSDRMNRELLERYPWINPVQVSIVGTPQFEPHLDDSRVKSRDVFCAELRLRPDKPILLFSGDDITTSPEDPQYLDDVASAIEDDPQLDGVQLIFRRCPADLSTRYNHVLNKHPWISESEPIWTKPDSGAWNDSLPTDEDLTLLTNVVAHSAASINIGSTIAMDFAVVGKPTIWLNYEATPGSEWFQRSPYRLPHFDSVRRHSPVDWVIDKRQLGYVLNQCIIDPDARQPGRQAWLEEELALPIAGTCTRFIETIKNLSRQ